MNGHTPGPWKEYFYVRNKRLKIGDWGWVQADGYHPVPLTNTKQHRSEDAANARLIAAAPELLEALREMVMLRCLGGATPDNDSATQRSVNAIDKAEGGKD